MKYGKNIRRWFWLAVLAVVGLFSIRCYRDRIQIDMNEKTVLPQWESVSSSQWQVLSQKKVFFAHMSVGSNILDGVRSVLQKHPALSLTPVKTSDPLEMRLPALYHAEVGYNLKPFLKIDSFRSLMEKIKTAAPDIALLKFCYVDVESNTDVEALFRAYRDAINELKRQFPNTLFLHCTVPLQSSPRSMKGKCKEIVKTFLGRPADVDDNYKRLQFNELVRNTWPAEQILDVAGIESATPEGFSCYKIHRKQKVPYLCSDYTTDGGHLNNIGTERVGQQFLIFLANAAGVEK